MPVPIRKPYPPHGPAGTIAAAALSAILTLTSTQASAAQLSGYFRQSAPGIFINIESRQTATTGPLSDSSQPIDQIILGFYEVDYGSIRLSARHLGLQDGTIGFSNAGSSAAFQDMLTITSPTAAEFSPGTMVARIDVSGNLLATGNGQSHYIVTVVTPSFGQQLSGAFYGPAISPTPGVIIGDDFGSYLLEIPFFFGHPFSLSVAGGVDATVRLNDSGSAWTNLSSTIGWGGILDIRDESNVALAEFMVTSESSYDYATVQVVPLPGGAWLLGTGLLGLATRKRLLQRLSL